MPDYEYVLSVNRYRNKANGQFVARETVLNYVDSLISAGEGSSSTLTDSYLAGGLSIDDYIDALKQELKSTFIQNGILGRGGRDLMGPSDWGQIGAMLRKQYAYLETFRSDLHAGWGTEGQIRNRATLYFKTAREAYERGNATAHGLPRLPAYPGDLTTICMSGCRCRWNYVKLAGNGNYDCYWEVSDEVNNCETCIKRRELWYPLQVRDGNLLPFIDVRAEAHVHFHDLGDLAYALVE